MSVLSKEVEYNKYHDGKIYIISAQQSDKIYIGSTTKTLKERFNNHKTSYKSYYLNGKQSYCTSYEILKFSDCNIKLLENFPCNTSEELREREQYNISQYPNSINKVKAYLSEEQKKEIEKKYYIENKEKITEYKKEYNIINRETIKEKREEYFEEYRNKNREKIKEKGKQIILCECGITYTYYNKISHLKSKRHNTKLEKQEQNTN